MKNISFISLSFLLSATLAWSQKCKIEVYASPALYNIKSVTLQEKGIGYGFFDYRPMLGQEYGINIGILFKNNIEIGIGTTYLKQGYRFSRYSPHLNNEDFHLDKNDGESFTETYGAQPYIKYWFTKRFSVGLGLHINQQFHAYTSEPYYTSGILIYGGENGNGEFDLFSLSVVEYMSVDASPWTHTMIDGNISYRSKIGLVFTLGIKYRGIFSNGYEYYLINIGDTLFLDDVYLNDLKILERNLIIRPSIGYTFSF